LPNDVSSDVLAGRFEFGALGGISYTLTCRINIDLEDHYGLARILNDSYYVDNSQLIRYHDKNQFAQIT